MGSTESTLQSQSQPQIQQEISKPKCKPCCGKKYTYSFLPLKACPDTRKIRDECVIINGEEGCMDLIKAHQDCMRAQGFNI